MKPMLCAMFIFSSLALPGFAQGHQDHQDNNAPFKQDDLDVSLWQKRFEDPERDVIKHRAAIVAALNLKPGQFVADIGAGTGAYLKAVAAEIGPQGHYFGLDIAPNFCNHMRDLAQAANLDHVTIILSRTDSATLPPNSVDMLLVVDTYHHFSPPGPMLASMFRALKPGGELVVVDFDRVEGKSRPWVLSHIRAGKDVFRQEIEAAGFSFVEEVKNLGLTENFFLRFTRPKE